MGKWPKCFEDGLDAVKEKRIWREADEEQLNVK